MLKLIRNKYRWISIFCLTATVIFLLSCTTGSNQEYSSRSNVRGSCSLGSAVESQDGIRRLALIIGVGEYKNSKVPDLSGPPQDALRFYELLTSKDGYRFPKENVCLLLDEKATTSAFETSFDQALVQRARKQDIAVIYYAGHGSRTKDRNGDEPDEWDETFMFHDARSGGVRDLTDDRFNRILTKLYSRTKNIAVFLDSCNSGTATRGDDNYTARFFDVLVDTDDQDASDANEDGDGASDLISDAMPGLVIFTAASDGTPALEKNGRGIFTDALLTVMSGTSKEAKTYAQIARQIPPLVAAESYQIPYFQGDLARHIFGNVNRKRPFGWEIASLGPPIKLAGPPLPGLGIGTEFRVYDGNVSGEDLGDPKKSKATLVIDVMTGLNADAHISAQSDNNSSLEPGDLAVLVRPADKFLKIPVTMRPPGNPGGISNDVASKLQLALNDHSEANTVIELVRKKGDFELSLDFDSRILLSGPENSVRNSFDNEDSAVNSLWQHARQRALMQIRSEGGSDFVANQTLKVELVESKKQNPCANGSWVQAPPNKEQIIPLCHAWNVKVRLSADSPKPLLVGGIVLSNDGSTFGFPIDGRAELLRPGQTALFNYRGETFMGTPPLNIAEQVIVYGTQESNPVPWHLLTDTAAARSVGPTKNGLYRALDRFLQPGARAAQQFVEEIDETTWTSSTITMRVEANTQFLKPNKNSIIPNQREYTIKNFDIRPYLPNDTSSKLHRLLDKAHWLANTSIEDGYSYKQHAWSKSSDDENLKVGIDCSRAIWFAFTRAGLRYNKNDQYITTAQMVASNSRMADEFERCDNDSLELGDILVYRDDKKGDGHVIMVIDPNKRIAWGSHGWDGNAKKLKIEPDTGVEYQLIKYKPDWKRWDRTTMDRKACWRHRQITAESIQTRGALGGNALRNACKAELQCSL